MTVTCRRSCPDVGTISVQQEDPKQEDPCSPQSESLAMPGLLPCGSSHDTEALYSNAPGECSGTVAGGPHHDREVREMAGWRGKINRKLLFGRAF